MKNITEIYEILKNALKDEGISLVEVKGDDYILVDRKKLLKVFEILKKSPELAFDCLMNQSGIDLGEKLGVVYNMFSYKYLHKLTLRIELNRDEPNLPSLYFIYKGSDLFERETAEMFGIKFEGHPNLKPLLLPEDWEGYPLRKDYKYPEKYKGIPCNVDFSKE